jgi:hypothetical protein
MMHTRSSGKERDFEDGLDYFGARYYASSTGRFSMMQSSTEAAQRPETRLIATKGASITQIKNTILLLLIISVSASAATLRVKLVDQTGAGFNDVLVIVKSLEGRGEVFRALTNGAGSVPARELTPGLYRLIATCPYGICQTKVSEFLVSDRPVEIELTLKVLPTRGNGVTIRPSDRMGIQVVDTEGRAITAAEVLVRDSEAQNEHWYKTNSAGQVEVELPLGNVTLIVLHNGRLKEETVTRASIDKAKAEGKEIAIQF